MKGLLRSLFFAVLSVGGPVHATRTQSDFDTQLVEMGSPATIDPWSKPPAKSTKNDHASTPVEDTDLPNAFIDISYRRVTSDHARVLLDQGMDRLIERFAKKDRDAFIKSENRTGFVPPEGCWIARVGKSNTSKTELQMTSPETLKLISHTMLRSVCTQNQPGAVLASMQNPVNSNKGDALSGDYLPPKGITPLAQTASMSFGLTLQESHASVVAGFHKAGGSITMEAGGFQSSPSLTFSAGEHDPRGAELMEQLMADYHHRMMVIIRDQELVKESGIENMDLPGRLRMGAGLRGLGISRDPKKEFDQLCGVNAFDSKKFWYGGPNTEDPAIAEEIRNLESTLAATRSAADSKRIKQRIASLKSAQKLANAWRNDTRSVRVKEARHGKSVRLTEKLRRIANGVNDTQDPPISYAQFAFEQMSADAVKARAGFERIAGDFKISEAYLAGQKLKGVPDTTEGPNVAEALRTMSFFCPKFAADMNAIGLRYQKRQYGPVLRDELRPNCRNYFAQLEKEFISMAGTPLNESGYCQAVLGAD